MNQANPGHVVTGAPHMLKTLQDMDGWLRESGYEADHPWRRSISEAIRADAKQREELVEELASTASMLRAACLVIHDGVARGMALKQAERVRRLIAKATESAS